MTPVSAFPDGALASPVEVATRCAPGAITCPRCARPIVGVPFVRPDSTLLTCKIRPPYGMGAAKACGQRVLVVPDAGGTCTVRALTEAQYATLRCDPRPVADLLREFGVAVEKAA